MLIFINTNFNKTNFSILNIICTTDRARNFKLYHKRVTIQIVYPWECISKNIKIDYNNIRELFYEKVKDRADEIFLICPGENTVEFTYAKLKLLIKNAQIVIL